MERASRLGNECNGVVNRKFVLAAKRVVNRLDTNLKKKEDESNRRRVSA